jgi:hypothetical protein
MAKTRWANDKSRVEKEWLDARFLLKKRNVALTSALGGRSIYIIFVLQQSSRRLVALVQEIRLPKGPNDEREGTKRRRQRNLGSSKKCSKEYRRTTDEEQIAQLPVAITFGRRRSYAGRQQ